MFFSVHLKMFDLKEDGKFKYLGERKLWNIKGSNHSMVGFVTLSFTGRQKTLYLSVLYFPQASTRVMIKQKISSHTHQGIYEIWYIYIYIYF